MILVLLEIKHPAVIGLDGLRALVTAVGEVLGCQRVRNRIGEEVDVRYRAVRF